VWLAAVAVDQPADQLEQEIVGEYDPPHVDVDPIVVDVLAFLRPQDVGEGDAGPSWDFKATRGDPVHDLAVADPALAHRVAERAVEIGTLGASFFDPDLEALPDGAVLAIGFTIAGAEKGTFRRGEAFMEADVDMYPVVVVMAVLVGPLSAVGRIGPWRHR